MVVEIEIVEHAETHAQHFLGFQKVTDIASAVMTAGRTLAAFLNGLLIQLIFRVEKVQLSVLRVNVAVTSVPARVYAVEEVHAPVHGLQNIGRCADTHQVNRFLQRKIGHNLVQNPVHFLVRLSHSQTAYSVAVQIKLRDLLSILDTDILINTALVDAEKHLMGVELSGRLFKRAISFLHRTSQR